MNIKSILLICFFKLLLLLPCQLFSESYLKTIDSLKTINNTSHLDINTKAKTLYNLSWYYYAAQQYDSAVDYSIQAFQYAFTNKIDTVVHKSALMLGAIYSTKSEYDSAAFYLHKGASYFESTDKTGYEGELARIYSLLANVLSEQLLFNDAYIYYDKSENIYLKKQDTTGLIFNKIAKGNLFTNIQLYDKALNEYDDALKLSKKSGRFYNLSYIYNDLSTLYKKNGDKQNAKACLFMTINALQKDNKPQLFADAYHNLSLLYSNQNNYDSAFYYNGLALEIFRKYQLLYRENSAYLCKCEFYLDQGDLNRANRCLDSIGKIQDVLNAKYFLLQSKLAYRNKSLNDAIHFAQKALVFAQKNKNIEDQKNSYELLYKQNRDKQNLSQALLAYEKYIVLKDSIYNQEKSVAIQKIIIQNIIDDKNEEIELAAIEHEKKQAVKDKFIWIAVASIIGLLSLLTIILLMFKNQKQQTKISEAKAELVKKEALEIKKDLEMKLLKEETEKLKREYEIEVLKKETEEIKKEIIHFSLQEIKNKEFIELTHSKLKAIKKSPNADESINNLYAIANQFLVNEQERTDFQRKVEEIQKSFFEKLDQINVSNGGKLTKTEKKLAALLKLQLTSKEIGSILNVEETSIEIYRSRLRKKLNIEANTPLIYYFNNL